MNESTLALMSFDNRHLLLPQSSVASIEMASELLAEESDPRSAGKLRLGALEWPAIALNANFEYLVDLSPDYRYCVAINDGQQPAFAILCEEVGSVHIGHGSELQPLQPCMCNAGNPIRALLLHEGRMMLLSDVDSLAGYLERAERIAA